MKDKFANFRAARAAKSSRAVVESDIESDHDIYDEVDDENYRRYKTNQLLKDDFVVEDNGEGYVDNGVDEWDHRYSDEEQEEEGEVEQKRERKVKKKSTIDNLFKPSELPKPKPKIEMNVDDILSEFGATPVKKDPIKKDIFGTKRKTPFFNKTIKTPLSNKKPKLSSEIDLMELPSEQPFSSPSRVGKRNVVELSEVQYEKIDEKEKETNEEKTVKREEKENQTENQTEKTVEDDSPSSDEEIVIKRPRITSTIPRSVNLTAQKPLSSPVRHPTRDPVPTSSPQPERQTAKLNRSQVQGDAGSFRMFWLDYAEVDGSLLLFGKILTHTGELVSGMVQVSNMYREIYFLPREEKTPEEVHEEIIPLLMAKYGVDSLRAKSQHMKYAFELERVPKEGDYLKVLLPFQTPKSRHVNLPSELEGTSFHHVFGSSTSPFEAFVLQRNVMGPCWLEISNGDFDSIVNTSHCRVEVSVGSAAQVTVESTTTPPPNLNMMALNVKTVLNAKTNKQEVGMVTIATYQNLPQDSPVSSEQPPTSLTVLARPVGGSLQFPPLLKKVADETGLEVRCFANEKTLLNCLAAMVKLNDPDVFLGHRMENLGVEVLMFRMHELRVSTWSVFGRRNRKMWPDKFGAKRFLSFQLREVFQGRLMCDVANELGQSLTMKCQSWDLHEMVDLVCGKKYKPLEINLANSQYAEDANSLVTVFSECAMQVKYIAEIAFRIQILSLSKQLTNLAGNAWCHTLGGTRAGRNEFILLHEFTRNGYIVPDKERHRTQDANDEEEAVSSKKSKYQGGLVFEPEKGLHKSFTLVMDFNSLYPSIIQEFNICFTTVDRKKGSEEMPSVPDETTAQGVLPRLLQNLVQRRREVKKLLAEPKNSPLEKVQYDIKQQALKLTANSMYGCLGYVNSRFYAKPLAMLVTNKGREILMDTRQLAESISLKVIYGDTDSVMIATGCDNFKEALTIGSAFKQQVNERYRLLEIDIDHVFKSLLLHAKKKYAAMVVGPNEKLSLEVKGLDMRRREYCQLSKEVSTYVLEKVLSDADAEDALNEIYAHLETVRDAVQNNTIRAEKFKINTRLSKDPTQYPGGKNMPPVQVALRLRKQGKSIKAGSVVTYVITAGDDSEGANDSSKGSPAERARALVEVMAKGTTLRPDPQYYLEKQIFAPVERLLERIDGIDIVRLATCLGLDSKRYEARSARTDTLAPLESTVSDSERFQSCEFLSLQCRCGCVFKFGGVQGSPDYKITYNGVSCTKCDALLSHLQVTAQLEAAVRNSIAKYYCGWLLCDDPACGVITRQISVYGKRCIGMSGKAHGCKGVMRYTFSDKQLYNQLLFFSSLFDVDKAKKRGLKSLETSLEKMNQQSLEALSEQNREFFTVCQSVVDKYLQDNGRRYVDMGNLFNFM